MMVIGGVVETVAIKVLKMTQKKDTKQRDSKYYRDNKEEIKQRRKERYAKLRASTDPEDIKKFKELKERKNSYRRKWIENNKEYFKEHRQMYYLENFEMFALSRKKYYIKNREKEIERAKIWAQNHPEKHAIYDLHTKEKFPHKISCINPEVVKARLERLEKEKKQQNPQTF